MPELATPDPARPETDGRWQLQGAATVAPAADGADPGPRSIEGTLYSGGTFLFAFGLGVIDLDTLQMPELPLPLLYNHSVAIGVANAIDFDDDGAKIMLRASLLIDDAPKAAEIVRLADAGFPWQLSIGVEGAEEWIDGGRVADVNGRTFDGPISVLRNARVREASVTEVGADPATEARVLSCVNMETFPMPTPKKKGGPLSIVTGLAKPRRNRDGSVIAELALVESDDLTVETLDELRPDLVEAILLRGAEEQAAEPEETPESNAMVAEEAITPEAPPEPDVPAAASAISIDAMLTACGGDHELAITALRSGMTVDQATAIAATANSQTRRAQLTALADGDEPVGPGRVERTPVESDDARDVGSPDSIWRANAEVRSIWTARADGDADQARRQFTAFARICLNRGGDPAVETIDNLRA